MAKEKHGFWDWMIEDLANTIEIKGAVEASRDENGKVNKWKAIGLSLGLGHTSDDEIATLAGLIEAENTFDNNDALTDDDSFMCDSTDNDLIIDSPSDSFFPEFEDTLIGNNNISAEDMELLSYAGFDALDLEFMSPDELQDAMEEAGIDTDYYDFE